MDITHDVKTFLATDLGRDTAAVGPGDSLLEAGILDSIGVMALVAFIEQRYGIKVDDEELMPDNFDSLDAITAFVSSKQG